ncbi:unnamed protein product [Rotaria socialis]|uniref:Uncharacterized protein n=1 Tax=Rotaria socialis TaxID=392032 RepID=A0A818E327_9BILA|nr:unnamed protein product [Rotaria socialis]CAF3378929.1 unnamed protein product [Rotaria socialis]CAF3454373.1 unnamed protein product [Rotaria socialis]CAF3456453.1 unnamed protein product [Rotaria socialis]CAF3785399.1 unnamed protein product [Rotaria socialis]
MGNSNSQTTKHTSISRFYLACQSGDIDIVKQMLTTMKLKEINRIEPNGSTALHAAASNGHFEIVELLLKNGCSTITTNKDEKTAAEECNDERICQLIQSSVAIIDNEEQINDAIPISNWVQIYENINNEDKSVLATKIMKLRLTTYLTNQFKTNGANRLDYIRNLILSVLDKDSHKHSELLSRLQDAKCCESPELLITAYVAESPFFRYINKNRDEVYFMELLIGLVQLQHRSFRGTAFRGISLNRADLDLYLWACHHPNSFIETYNINSASEICEIAKQFAKHYGHMEPDTIMALFIIHFSETCETAISVTDISLCPQEKEVLIMPGTFFQVISVEKSPSDSCLSDMTIIKLQNIPVSRSVLLKTIYELR